MKLFVPNLAVSHFKINSALGKGGMGEVFLVQDTKLKRQLALKTLPRDAVSVART